MAVKNLPLVAWESMRKGIIDRYLVSQEAIRV
jgi:hypothetical protein